MKIPVMIIAALSVICLSGSVSAELYQWVDEDGVMHFSNVPVEAVGQSNIKVSEEIENVPMPEAESPPQSEPRHDSGHSGDPEIIRSAVHNSLMDLEEDHEEKLAELNSEIYEKEKELENIGRLKISNVKTDRDYEHNRKKEEEYYNCQREISRLRSAVETENFRYDNEKSKIQYLMR